MSGKKVSTATLSEMKQKGEQIVALTAYDAPTATLVEEAGVDVVLVGDSVANVKLGYPNTLPVTPDEILHHVKAVSRGMTRPLLVADMPYLSYEIDQTEALKIAGRFVKEGGAEAVKVEGGMEIAPVVKELLRINVPVMGHLGLTPQAVNRLGGFRVQGRRPQEAEKILTDAKILEGAGVFAIVLECVPTDLAAEVSKKVSVPTIGIGAGPRCDGQILVVDDLLGMSAGPLPRFVKKYVDLRKTMLEAMKSYTDDVRTSAFPQAEHSYEPRSAARR